MKRFTFFSIAIFMMMACSEEAKHDSFVEPTIDYTIEQKNDLISSYAQILASSIVDAELRKYYQK